VDLLIKKINSDAILPIRATSSSAGLDLCACIEKDIKINPGETVKVNTGVAIALPDNTVGLIFGRSGLGIKFGIAPANAVGVIDSDYRGELIVGLHNFSSQVYEVKNKERIAQLVVVPIEIPKLILKDELPETNRGENGFGSTGRI